MKKTITITLILILLFAFTACSRKNRLYTVALPSGGSYGSSAAIELDGFDYEPGSDRFVDESIEKTREFTLDGLSYKGEYQYTERSSFYECETDVYRSEGANGFVCECNISKRDGSVAAYSFSMKNGYETRNGNKSYEDCKMLAEATAKRITGTNDLVFVENGAVKEAKNVPGCGDVYEYTFVRMLGKYKTNIVITVGVNTDGWAVYCDAVLDQSYTGLLLDKGFIIKTKAMDDKYFDKKIKSLYKGADVKWEQTDSCFAKLKDGSLCVIYDIAVTEKDKSPETVKLLRYVDNK